MNIIRNIKLIECIGKTVNRTVSLVNTSFPIGKILENDFSSHVRAFSSLSNTFTNTIKSSCLNLKPYNFNVIPSCGMKVKGKLKRRCNKCYYARIDGRMYILCDAYPRHKQMAMVKREKYTWIISHCSQTKCRPY